MSEGAETTLPGRELRGVLEALARIERRLDRLESQAEAALHTGRDALGLFTDVVDRKIATAQARGLDVDQRLANLVRAAEHLSSDQAVALLESTFSRLDRVQSVLESGLLDAAAVSVVARAGRALADAAAEPPRDIGALGLLGALGDRDVRKALGFLLSFARHMGRSLRREPTPAELPAAGRTKPVSSSGGAT